MVIEMGFPKKSKIKTEVIIEKEKCNISDSLLSINVLKIDNKRLSLSIYNQIVSRDPLDHTDPENPKILGPIVGKIHRKINTYHHHETRDVEFDILWITPTGHLATWPLSIIFETKGSMENIEIPNRINILKQNDRYTQSQISKFEKEFNVIYPRFSEWEGFPSIPEKPENPELEFNNRNLNCGITNDSRLELIEILKRDMVKVTQYNQTLKEWSDITHPLYDEYIKLLTPIVIKINNLIDKRNLVYQNLIKQLTETQQIFVGS